MHIPWYGCAEYMCSLCVGYISMLLPCKNDSIDLL